MMIPVGIDFEKQKRGMSQMKRGSSMKKSDLFFSMAIISSDFKTPS